MSTPQRLASPSNEERTVELPVDPQRGIGLATVVYRRDGHIEDRRYHFQDDRIIPADMVARMTRHQNTESQELTDSISECSMSEGGEPQGQAKETCHCYQDTEMDESSKVINGDMVDGLKPSSLRKHHMRGGSVKGNSKLVNGDIDRHAFLAFFCRD
ncbi:hypothetical protein BDV32DRAFT_157785 [Aspergillus pseudonomiae]|uniref:Uncharacterized protein n=1 Tax=Aspergillus pseudonomiae TaxID=1506151 RepID=A0A5N7D9V9_9EURO|nr:uncharacterized protein BDV37DRAFT_283861 [Aspergillus pseudonomiae]KAB8261775.1 hypothetical protein BDV32DRAFT_157785 [Aspergillus pseudonomiae]KAE8403252.1 hypothetical protein BDV37DRAFT_283861 [Aspergillus pseudonomiae]